MNKLFNKKKANSKSPENAGEGIYDTNNAGPLVHDALTAAGHRSVDEIPMSPSRNQIQDPLQPGSFKKPSTPTTPPGSMPPVDSRNGANGASPASSPASKPKLVFHCQQAQGSPTGLISGFTSVRELYQKIAECYDMDPAQILFCTLNTHKVDMAKLLGGQIGLDDFIFAHVKGQAKEIEIEKEDDALGLTITDNGAGYAFIKRIKPDSLMDRIEHINVGDHIEKINGQTMIGSRHFEVARKLKDIPRGATFTIRIVEPLKAGFAAIGAANRGGKPGKASSVANGKATLRLRAKGPATVEDAPDDVVSRVTEKINSLLESFLGINDIELATSIWELGQNKTNTIDFSAALSESELAAFGFTDDFVFDLWGVISDAKSGRIKNDPPKFEMQF